MKEYLLDQVLNKILFGVFTSTAQSRQVMRPAELEYPPSFAPC